MRHMQTESCETAKVPPKQHVPSRCPVNHRSGPLWAKQSGCVNCNGFSKNEPHTLHGLHATGQGFGRAPFSHERCVLRPGLADPPAAAPERCADGDEPAHSVERWRWRRVLLTLLEVALLDSLL